MPLSQADAAAAPTKSAQPEEDDLEESKADAAAAPTKKRKLQDNIELLYSCCFIFACFLQDFTFLFSGSILSSVWASGEDT